MSPPPWMTPIGPPAPTSPVHVEDEACRLDAFFVDALAGRRVYCEVAVPNDPERAYAALDVVPTTPNSYPPVDLLTGALVQWHAYTAGEPGAGGPFDGEYRQAGFIDIRRDASIAIGLYAQAFEIQEVDRVRCNRAALTFAGRGGIYRVDLDRFDTMR